MLLKTEEGAERRGQPLQPHDTSEGPRLPRASLSAGGAAEATARSEQGAPPEPQQLSPATEVRAGSGRLVLTPHR